MKKVKIDFSKLIGNHYPIETKMFVLDWMLKTGKRITYSHGWYIDGINKSLLSYSANNHNAPACLPKDNDFDLFFDAIFARAIYAQENNVLKIWRKNESIFSEKYRMLNINDSIPVDSQKNIYWYIWTIFEFEGKLLKKKFHHSEHKNGNDPKIINIAIYTTGSGWIVKYEFSFKEFDYESGWTNSFQQKDDESIFQFLKKSYDELINLTI